MEKIENAKRWRLILGQEGEKALENTTHSTISLSDEERLLAEALEAIYDRSNTALGGKGGAGNGPSSPRVAKWLGDIRRLFDKEIVSIIQQDAMERKGLKQLLFEPEILETMTPDIKLASTLLNLKNQVPEKSKEAVRQYIQKIVDEINKSLQSEVQRAVTAAINKKNHAPRGTASSLDFHYTIRRNLKNYNTTLGTIIPEKLYFYEHQNKINGWNVILDIDQSGSMGESVMYSSIIGCILAKMSSINTRIIAFDTNVVDLTELYEDPVDMLFGIQLGGGTDIHKSVVYCQQFITNPKKTLFFLVSDLEEFGNQGALVNKMKFLKESGVTVVTLLAIGDDGVPYYNKNLAAKFASFGIPCFACTPNLLPRLLEKALRGEELRESEFMGSK